MGNSKALVPEQLTLAVTIAKEIDGIEMGVLQDGRAYVNGRSLARLCGAAASTIINQGDRWLDGDRTNKLAQMLVAQGFERPSLFETVYDGKKKIHAYPDDIATAILEYYAFDAKNDQALANARQLLRGGLRLFIYHALGYDPSKRVPDAWRHFHDRQVLHSVPHGYFSVFKEASDFELALIRGGLPMDENTIPDISVGKAWSEHWKAKNLESRFGPRKTHDHNFPESFKQSASNPQPMKVYPVDALGEFRRWMDLEYIPKKFPKYLQSKVAKRILPASTAELLLAEVTPLALPEAG